MASFLLRNFLQKNYSSSNFTKCRVKLKAENYYLQSTDFLSLLQLSGKETVWGFAMSSLFPTLSELAKITKLHL